MKNLFSYNRGLINFAGFVVLTTLAYMGNIYSANRELDWLFWMFLTIAVVTALGRRMVAIGWYVLAVIVLHSILFSLAVYSGAEVLIVGYLLALAVLYFTVREARNAPGIRIRWGALWDRPQRSTSTKGRWPGRRQRRRENQAKRGSGTHS